MASASSSWLVEHGYELGNHTLWHANLGKYDETVVRDPAARTPRRGCSATCRAISSAPWRSRTASTRSEVGWAMSGSAKGMSYQPRRDPDGRRRRRAVPVREGASIPPGCPASRRVERDLNYWLTYFDKNPGERFVSDGEPATVTVPAARRESSAPTCPRPSRWWSAS